MANSMTVELLRRLQRLERQVEHQHTKPPRDTAMLSGGRLLGTLVAETRYGGGRLQWTFNGQGPVNWGAGATAWTETSIAAADYASVTPTDALKQAGGGPYVALNGSDEYLVITDPAWAEPGSEEMFVWQWCYATAFGQDEIIVGKDTGGAGHRNWVLKYNNSTTAFRFLVSTDGTAVISVDSATAPAVDTWYFVAGYYQASTTVNLYWAAAGDTEVVEVTNAVGVPASVSAAGTPDLTIGAWSGAASGFWDGRIGIGAGWFNVPAANIGTYAQHLFAQSRWAYGGKG